MNPEGIQDTVEERTIFETPIIVSEVGRQKGLSNVTIVLSKLVDSQGSEVTPLAIPLSFSLQPGEARILQVQYDTTHGAPGDTYNGVITVTGRRLDDDQVYEEIVPVALEFASSSIPSFVEPTWWLWLIVAILVPANGAVGYYYAKSRNKLKPPKSNVGICSRCGTQNSPDAEFCRRCGNPVNRGSKRLA